MARINLSNAPDRELARSGFFEHDFQTKLEDEMAGTTARDPESEVLDDDADVTAEVDNIYRRALDHDDFPEGQSALFRSVTPIAFEELSFFERLSLRNSATSTLVLALNRDESLPAGQILDDEFFADDTTNDRRHALIQELLQRLYQGQVDQITEDELQAQAERIYRKAMGRQDFPADMEDLFEERASARIGAGTEGWAEYFSLTSISEMYRNYRRHRGSGGGGRDGSGGPGVPGSSSDSFDFSSPNEFTFYDALNRLYGNPPERSVLRSRTECAKIDNHYDVIISSVGKPHILLVDKNDAEKMVAVSRKRNDVAAEYVGDRDKFTAKEAVVIARSILEGEDRMDSQIVIDLSGTLEQRALIKVAIEKLAHQYPGLSYRYGKKDVNFDTESNQALLLRSEIAVDRALRELDGELNAPGARFDRNEPRDGGDLSIGVAVDPNAPTGPLGGGDAGNNGSDLTEEGLAPGLGGSDSAGEQSTNESNDAGENSFATANNVDPLLKELIKNSFENAQADEADEALPHEGHTYELAEYAKALSIAIVAKNATILSQLGNGQTLQNPSLLDVATVEKNLRNIYNTFREPITVDRYDDEPTNALRELAKFGFERATGEIFDTTKHEQIVRAQQQILEDHGVTEEIADKIMRRKSLGANKPNIA